VEVLISVDLEGVAGVATRQQTLPSGRDYSASRGLMTAEANAAVAGAFDSGATSVVVVDSHGPADNLLAELVDQRASLISGDPKPLDMVQGLSAETGVVLFVGYHCGPESSGVLGHTFSGGAFTDVRLNGVSVTEADLNALVAAELGVPVGLVTGDDVTCSLAEQAIPGVVTVAVKSAVGRTAARSLHPRVACAAIGAGASRAVALARAGELRPVPVPDRLMVEADLRPSGAAELAALVPGTSRAGARTVAFEAATPRAAVDVLIVWASLAAHYANR
jgi:D-amino peptidase